MSEAEAAKAYWSVNHCQSPRLLPLGEGQDHRYKLGEIILSYHPRSIFEFGCSSGRNLAAIRTLDKEVHLAGIDINRAALAAGQAKHDSITLSFGDENYLYYAPDADVVFTVSVLDHIPDWKPVYKNLKRIAKKALILLEPVFVEKTGVIYEGDLDTLVEAAPFTYSRDYVKNDPELRVVQDLPITEIPGTLGPLYKVFVYERK